MLLLGQADPVHTQSRWNVVCVQSKGMKYSTSGIGWPKPSHNVPTEATQLCPTLCDRMDCSLSGSSVHGIFQARVLEWIAIVLRFKILPGLGIMCLNSSQLFLLVTLLLSMAFPGGSDGKVSACNAGDPGSIPGSGRSPGEGNGTPLQHSCLENPMDGGA